jgi:hypothetical protein
VDVDSFVRDGFAAVRQAVDAGTAAACRKLIWQSMGRRGVRQSDPATWPALVPIDGLDAGPFTAAGLSPAPTVAYDELIGPGRWRSPVHVGRAVMVRFPSQDRAGAGYHIEASYPGPGGQGLAGQCPLPGRGLLALFLLTDVDPDDAPTRLVCGSHLTAAVPGTVRRSRRGRRRPAVVPLYAVPSCHARDRDGRDVFLCHPFIVHTATWPHRGTGPRMIAQPAVSAPAGFTLDGTDPSPVAQAITSALAMME